MLDVGWSELLIIGVVALIVVGPKDLPVMFRTFGRFTGKMRVMARDFQRAMDEAAKASGMDETVRDLKSMTSKKAMGLDALETAAAKFEKWDPTKPVREATAAAAASRAAAAPEKGVTLPSASEAVVRPAGGPAAAAAAAPGPETQALREKRAAKS
ncbi:MAG: Sec-independent protein translocase protein TatB, partial [Rhodobacteraceae bacterium]|nr:Sec-independent protein translocase protein TatB [Paracoccaceae bacterium]